MVMDPLCPEPIDSSLLTPNQQVFISPSHSPREKLLSRLGLPARQEESPKVIRQSSTQSFGKNLDSAVKGIPQSSTQRRHCTCMIFDWDDTLFCTTHMHSGKQIAAGELQKLDDAASQILAHALLLGITKIITNAKGGWVEDTAQRNLPQVYALLDRIEIISARDLFEHKHPEDPVTWKVEAFCAIKENSKVVANLTAIGDSEAEMVAIREMAKLYDISFFKAVRMKSRPSCQELRKELKILNDKLDTIVNGVKNFSISLHSRPNNA